jgi:hypothetical protein
MFLVAMDTFLVVLSLKLLSALIHRYIYASFNIDAVVVVMLQL